jgi:hypothetical protein
MVDIIIGTIVPVQNDPNKRNNPDHLTPRNKNRFREKRKKQSDRRQSVRDGIVVTLSNQVDRRKGPDRRKS